LGVVEGVGDDVVRLNAETVSGDSVVVDIGLVDDLDLPLLLTFEPKAVRNPVIPGRLPFSVRLVSLSIKYD
jgi:hypothetical protein